MAFFEDSVDEGFNPLNKYVGLAATTGDALSLPEEIVHGSIATIADIGTTFWNSLTPKKYEASTQDLLSRIDTDALQVYNEHPDAVKTASFIGGMFLPVGAAMKGMSLLRSGAKGASWFSEAGRASNLFKATQAMAEAGPINAALNKAKWDIYRNVALNNVLDSAVAEFAILGTMSAHPYMEDYTKDLGRNFLIGTVFGGVVGTGFGSIIAKGEITRAISPIEQELNKTIFGVLKKPVIEAGISEISHIGEQIAVKAAALDDLKNLVTMAEDPLSEITLAPYILARIKDTVITESAKLYTTLIDASKGELKTFIETAPDASKQYLLDFATRVENAGLDKIAFAEVEASKLAGKGSGILAETATFIKQTINKEGEKVAQNVDAYYSPIFDRYFAKSDAVNYLTMSDLGTSIKALEREANPKQWKFHRPEASIEREVLHSAEVDADFAKAMLATKDMSEKELGKLVVHPEDLSMLKAIYLRAAELGATDLNIQVRADRASWKATNQLTLKRTGLAPDYGNKLRAMEKDWNQFSLYNHGQGEVGHISREAEDTLVDWVRGHYDDLRNASAIMKGLIRKPASVLNPTAYAKLNRFKGYLEEMKNSKRSQSLRDYFSKIADADGNVWLYRGMSRDPSGHMTVESYSIIPEKAAEFGKGYDKAVKLYKVHVDDIIGTVKDFGPTGKRPEILAFPPTRDFYDIPKNKLKEIPTEILLKDEEAAISVALTPSGGVLSSLDAITQAIQAETLRSVQTLAKNGYGLEAISIRTGTPLDTVAEILSTGYAPPGGLFKYTSVQDIEQALQTEKRTLALTTNQSKNLSADIKANLNALGLDQMSAGISEQYLLTSQSGFVRDLGQRFLSADFKALTNELLRLMPDVAGTSMKSSLFASANQVLSANPGLAAVATVMGKEAIALRNHVKEAFEKPIATAMAAVMKDSAALIEANTALNLNAALSGFRLYKDGQFWLKEIVDGKEQLVPALFRGNSFTIQTPAVRDLFEQLQNYGREMYEIKNVKTKAVGQQGISDIGFWVPSVNVSNKEIAYVHDIHLNKTTMLFAKTPEELNAGIADYKKAMLAQGRLVEIITKDKQAAFNVMAGRHDPMYMEIADLTKRHGGSSTSTFVETDASGFQEILSGYNNYVERGIDDLIKLQLAPVMDHLKTLSDISQTGYNASKANVIQKLINKPVDAGQTLANILMGKSNLNQHPIWSEWQQRTQAGTDILLNTVSEVFSPLWGKSKRTPEMWKEIQKDMTARGILNPFAGAEKMLGLDRFLAEGKATSESLTPRSISLFNGLAATSLLRFMELGQPLVNALSLPILTSGAINRQMASNFFGAELNKNAKFTVPEVMHGGIRLMMHSTEGLKWSQLGETKNLFSPELRNITELMEQARSLETGAIKTLEDAMESSFVRMMSKPSDFSESMVRKVSYFNGIYLAKKAYPGLSDTGVLTFARNFMDEAIGNYTPQQRPAMFQGTFGVGFGLFQTYMLTLAQQIYRGVEHRDWKTIGKQMLTQATIFGGASLPGFHLVSEAIGENFSDNHIDLETGLFRAIDDDVANAMLYGLPSSIGPGLTTRGDIQPRLPNPFQGINSVAAANILGQAYTAAERVAKAAGSADENAGRAMLEALSLQSVSRPIARLSELVTGRSLTGAGNAVMDVPRPFDNIENILTQSTFSRILATRPIQEIKAREAMQLDSLYGQADTERRKAVSQRLKAHIRSGRMDTNTLDELAYEYLRTGTPTGWRAAVNEALLQEAGPASNTVKRKLGPDSPLQMMIEDQDGTD